MIDVEEGRHGEDVPIYECSYCGMIYTKVGPHSRGDDFHEVVISDDDTMLEEGFLMLDDDGWITA